MDTGYKLKLWKFPQYPRLILIEMLAEERPEDFGITRGLIDDFERMVAGRRDKGILVKIPEGVPAIVGAVFASVAHRLAPEGMAFYDHQTNNYRVVWRRKRNHLGWDELYTEVIIHGETVRWRGR